MGLSSLPMLRLRLKPTPLSFMPTTTVVSATTATAMVWEDTVDMPVWDMPATWAMPDTPDTVLELTDIMLDTMVSTETESRVLPVSTPLTFPSPVPPVKGVMLRLIPRLTLMPLPTTVMLMVDTPMLPVLTDTDTVWEDTTVDTWADTMVDTTEFTHPITESAATTLALKSPVNFVFKKITANNNVLKNSFLA